MCGSGSISRRYVHSNFAPMAISRKQALRRLEGLARAAAQHLEIHIPALIGEHPENVPHWREEFSAWFAEMQRLTRHVGKRTAQHWNERIEDLILRSDDLLGTE